MSAQSRRRVLDADVDRPRPPETSEQAERHHEAAMAARLAAGAARTA